MTMPALSNRAVRWSALAATAALSVSLTACGGGDSGGSTSSAPSSLRAEQLSEQLQSSIDQDNTTAFSEQLTARWAELEPTAKADGLTTSSDIGPDGGTVTIAGGGVTCTVTVNNEPPAVDRTCQDG